jgi:hypothetical protein
VTLQSEYARHDPYPWLYGVEFNWLLRSPERRRLEIKVAQLDTECPLGTHGAGLERTS